MPSEELSPVEEKALYEEAKSRNNIIPNDVDRKFRTLVICYDGTGDEDDKDVTNVIELRNMLHGWHKGEGKIDPELQEVFYDRGLGTLDPHVPGYPEWKLPFKGLINYASQTADKAIAWDFNSHVINGYIWLAHRYREGDRICIFGFSRGAYTARVLAGMLSKVGLLPPQTNLEKMRYMAKEAFNSYELHGYREAWEHSAQFRVDNKCQDVEVRFLGCWDTVNSVGLIWGKQLPYTSENPIVRTFRHAIALDERRAKFTMNMWGSTEDETHIKVAEDQRKEKKKPGFFSREYWTRPKEKTKVQRMSLDDLKLKFNFTTDEEEVWFAGAHCDIGGGSVPTETRPNLAHIPLRWMIRECFKTNSGIIFKENMLRDNFGLDPKLLYPVVKPLLGSLKAPPGARVQKAKIPGWLESKPESKKRTKIDMVPDIEDSLDAKDALAPIYDQKDIKSWRWKIVETVTWSEDIGRKIPHPVVPGSDDDKKFDDPRLHKIRVHRTVKTRMQTPMEDGTFYIPAALLGGKGGPTLDKVLDRVHWVGEDED